MIADLVLKAKDINLFLLLLLTSACSLTRNVPEDRLVLYDTKVSGVNKEDRRNMQGLFKQTPNTRIPIFNGSLGVSLYQLGALTYNEENLIARRQQARTERDSLNLLLTTVSTDRERRKLSRKVGRREDRIASLNRNLSYGNFLMRTGNERVLYSPELMEETRKQLQFYLSNNGYFDAEVTEVLRQRRKKAYVDMQVSGYTPYLIRSFEAVYADTALYQALETYPDPIRVGNRYEQAVLSRDRQAIEDYLRERGYYTFNKSFIRYEVEKNPETRELEVKRIISANEEGLPHAVYLLDSIQFFIDAPSENLAGRNQSRRFRYRDIDFRLYEERYSERILASRVFLRKGDVFKRSDVIETQRQLANLDIFRFINITFEMVGDTLIPRIFTQPSEKYQLVNQLGASITEQVPGPFFSHSLRNRNLFRGAEIFEFNFRAGLEGVVSATGEGGVFRSREVSTSGSILFPRFLSPVKLFQVDQIGRYNPQTRLLLGYNYVDRPEYNREGLNAILGYTWNTRNFRQQFTLNVVDANFIRSSLSDDFNEILEDLQNQGNNLINSFLPSYVSSVSGQAIFNINQYGNFQKRSASLLRLYAESGGTTLNLLQPEFVKARNLAYFQFLKFQADYRRFIPLEGRQTMGYRLNLGVAKPYGVSEGILPYEKYFFAGGSTSIRAWQPRRLGPGSFTPPVLENGGFDYRFEQPGDILLEAMFEYRTKIYGYFDGALFLDIGNSWAFFDDPTRPGAQFQWDRFFTELAVGTGVGLRMDFDFLVFRLDMGIKAFDPARPLAERFILGDFFTRFPGLPGQTVFNIGIGYPF